LGQPPNALVDLVFSNTEGNPFIKELYRHLVEPGQFDEASGDLWPELKAVEVNLLQSLKVVIGRRLARLSNQTQTALGFAAVIGRSFTFELLQAASGENPEQLLDRLEAAERAGLIASTLDYPAARFGLSGCALSVFPSTRRPGGA
jgi:predicted ATPase